MELRHLRYFIKVAELKSFSEAAKLLYTSQGNLSKQIKQLEDEMGVSLLIRDSRYVGLSDYGEQFLPYAQQILRYADASMDKMKDISNLESGCLNLGVTYSFFPLLKETARVFMKRYPNIKLNLYCLPMEKLMQMLESREIDLALSYKPSTYYEHIDSNILFVSDLCAIVSRNNPLASQESIRLSELEKHKLALPIRGSQARSTFDNILYGQNYKFNICLETNDIHFMLDMVSSSNLVTILSKSSISEMPNLRAIVLDNPGVEMVGSYHLLKGSYCKKAAKEMLRLLIEKNAFVALNENLEY